MTDRELSEAVARVLVPTFSAELVSRVVADGVMNYATDWDRVPEMIAWLNKHAHHVVITCYATGANIHDPIYVESMRIQASGKTLQEALCRLILAVDGAKKESKKP
jgi:hypothetical protein